MTDSELVEMGIKMIKREKRLMIKKQEKALKIHDKKMSKLEDELTGLIGRRIELKSETSKEDTVTER